jgi:thiamine-monophosphate kinase
MTEHPPAAATEATIIERLRQRFAMASPRLLTGIGDDCAVLHLGNGDPGGRALNARDWLVTTDLLIEGVHFDLRWLNLADAGYKALAVNLSDIAAMGGTAVFAFGCLAVPPGTAPSAVEELLDGVEQAAREAGVILAGGDTVRGPQWAIGFTVLGEVQGAPLLRASARPGDTLWHTGVLGLSALGLARLCAGEAEQAGAAALSAHRRPQAQLAAGQWLRAQGLATACMDTSDSLAQCLLQLAEASGAGLLLDFARYPFAPALNAFATAQKPWRAGGARAFSIPARYQLDKRVARQRSLAEYVLASAEDYQLIFTTPPQVGPAELKHCPVPVTRLGTIVPLEEGRYYRGEDGRTMELTALGWRHL